MTGIKKRIFAAALSAALCLLLLAGCLGERQSGGKSEDAPAQQTVFDKNEIRVGVCAELSGINSAEGLSLEKGIQMAVREINGAGGVNGRALRVITYDVGDGDELLPAAQKLLTEEGASIIITACGYPLDRQALETGGLDWVQIDCGPRYRAEQSGAEGYFSLGADESVLLETLADTIMKQNNTQLGVISCDDPRYSEPLEELVGLLEGCSLHRESFSTGDMDFIAQIDRIIADNPTGIICYGPVTETAMIVKQLRARGYRRTIYGTENMVSLVVSGVAGEAADDVVFAAGSIVSTSVGDISEISNTRMQEAVLGEYVRQYGELPKSILAFKGYDAILAAAAAMEEVNDGETGLEGRFRALDGLEGSSGFYDLSKGVGMDIQAPGTYVIENQLLHRQ